jgi:hypothetical protein
MIFRKPADPFGLEREKRITQSGIRNTFTPHKPIKDSDLLFGRQFEVSRLVEHLNTPGQHAILFGDRGVGKSSLANIACEVILQNFVGGNLIRKRCDSVDTFVSIVSEPLSRVGIDININCAEEQSRSEAKIGVDKIIVANTGKGHQKTVVSAGYASLALLPSWVANKLSKLEALLLIDEFDALRSAEDKGKVAQLIKLLSDEGSSFKILIVGIADTAAQLIAAHQSVPRCLKETRIARMDERALRSIIIEGQKRHSKQVEFSNEVVDRIVSLSSGYAHFTHLLTLKCAEDAIGNNTKAISLKDLEAAMSRAVDDVEGSLKKVYNDATRSANTSEYKKIVFAAANCLDEFPAADLRSKYEEL